MRTNQPSVRGWTDDQLRAAVASEHSWRGVARALGLRETSTNNVRRHAARLRLDTSHFTGRRPWSDDRLREAVAQASSWVGVLSHLQLTDTGTSRLRVRGHAARLGLDCSHLDPPARDRAAVTVASAASTPPQPGMLRLAAPYIAVVWFTLRGYATAVPTEPQAYDLLVNLPDGVRRVQVKSSTSRSPHNKWKVSVSHRPYSLDKSAGRAPYDPASVDYFFVVDGEGGLYLIPSRVLAGRIGISVDSYGEYRVGCVSSLLDWLA